MIAPPDPPVGLVETITDTVTGIAAELDPVVTGLIFAVVSVSAAVVWLMLGRRY